jgi:hypothetical protein
VSGIPLGLKVSQMLSLLRVSQVLSPISLNEVGDFNLKSRVGVRHGMATVFESSITDWLYRFNLESAFLSQMVGVGIDRFIAGPLNDIAFVLCFHLFHVVAATAGGKQSIIGLSRYLGRQKKQNEK